MTFLTDISGGRKETQSQTLGILGFSNPKTESFQRIGNFALDSLICLNKPVIIDILIQYE